MTRLAVLWGTAALLAAGWAGAAVAQSASDAAAIKRGEYIFHAGGCESCHTDRRNKGQPLAGGAPIVTPFGTFYPPNITPDPQHGIGRWTDAQFIRAMREGIAPDGSNYFPSFPYTSFTFATDRDLLDLKAYLMSRPAVDKPNRPHDMAFPFRWRFLQTFWRWFNFEEGPYKPDIQKSATWNRGAYLVTALTHCAECHTPRNIMGGLERSNWMAGNPDGPDGEHIPNITPDPDTGIGNWKPGEIAFYLQIGMDPSGDAAGSLMADVVEHSTSKLTEADLKAIAEYISSLPPVRSAVPRKKREAED